MSLGDLGDELAADPREGGDQFGGHCWQCEGARVLDGHTVSTLAMLAMSMRRVGVDGGILPELARPIRSRGFAAHVSQQDRPHVSRSLSMKYKAKYGHNNDMTGVVILIGGSSY